MKKATQIESAPVFWYFEKICAIPHGSGDMDALSEYCMRFAEENGLQAVCDEAKNVVIYKPGTKGYENAEPVILQGHLDMVCQKTEEFSLWTLPKTAWRHLQTAILYRRKAPPWAPITVLP